MDDEPDTLGTGQAQGVFYELNRCEDLATPLWASESIAILCSSTLSAALRPQRGVGVDLNAIVKE